METQRGMNSSPISIPDCLPFQVSLSMALKQYGLMISSRARVCVKCVDACWNLEHEFLVIRMGQLQLSLKSGGSGIQIENADLLNINIFIQIKEAAFPNRTVAQASWWSKPPRRLIKMHFSCFVALHQTSSVSAGGGAMDLMYTSAPGCKHICRSMKTLMQAKEYFFC